MGVSERYRSAADLPAVIPVFPLRRAILLPRTTLPLNIFEPRYLAMVDDAIAGSRIIGVIQPSESTDPAESPAGRMVELRRIGCAGRITAFQELDDGRHVITLAGIARFEVTSEIPSAHPYRTCAVSCAAFADDFIARLGEDSVDREELLRVLKAYLERRQFRADWRAITGASSEFLVNSLSVISPYGPEEKQALLEAPDLKTRARILIALAEMEMASGSADGGSGSTLQ